MRTITEHINLYTFKGASEELREKIRVQNFYDGSFFEHTFKEWVDSIETLAEKLGVKVDCAISASPRRGEYIKFIGDIYKEYLEELSEKDCPLTGVYMDYVFIGAVQEIDMQLILDAFNDGFEYHLSDESLIELCEINGYEFREDGTLY